MWVSFERFELALSPKDAEIGSHSGDCQSDIEYLLTVPYIAKQIDAIPMEKIVAELSEYGAWDSEELADDEWNRKRILWIACGNLVEELHQLRQQWETAGHLHSHLIGR